MFGKKLRELRIENNTTQKKLAEILGCNQSMISQWEKEICEPTENYIRKAAIYFDVTTDYLLGLEDYAGNKVVAKNYIHNINNSGEIKF